MAIMSSFKFILVTLVVILLNENLFCNCEPGLYLRPYKGPTQTRCKREAPVYSHHQPASYQVPQGTYPVVTSGVQPLSTYHGNYQPIANTVQQPMAYHLQPIQQGFYAQPGTSTRFLQPVATASQPAVRFVQPEQQVQYIKSKPTEQVEYIQPAQQVEYVQPSISDFVKPIKPQKQIYKNENNPHVAQTKSTTQILNSNAQPVKYTIPTAHISHQAPSQAYYSMPSSYPQSYSIPQTSFTTYPQGHVIPEVSYPQGYPIPETSYPQGYPVSQTSYPQGYPVPQTSYPQGYPVPETSYPQVYPAPATSYSQVYSVPETSYPQGYPVPETSYPQGYPVREVSYPQYPVPETSYSQGYPVNNAHPEIVEGVNYIQTSPKYLRQESISSIYPYGNPNVKIYSRTNDEVFQLPDSVNTPVGKIDVELIDVMPYRPGTEPIRKVPRVNSIEAIIKPKKTSDEDIEIDENNSIEPTTRSSISLFG